ncbi:hypothetical protein ABIG06_000252 [Bradyrhizobium sp. USDA 326]
MLDVAMIERGLEKTGKSKGGLAAAMGVRPGAVSEILGGERLVKASEIIPIMEYLELNLAPIMGRVGAGAVIEPDYEQVPPEGLGDITLPFPIMGRDGCIRDRGRFDAAQIRERRRDRGLQGPAPSAVELLR